MPIQLDFTLRRWAEMAEHDPSLRTRQPFKAAYERDYGWLGTAMAKHYEGDDGDLRLLMGAVGEAFGDMSVEDYAAEVGAFFAEARTRRSTAVPRLRLPADGGAAALPRGTRLQHLHRLRRRPRLHAPDRLDAVRIPPSG